MSKIKNSDYSFVSKLNFAYGKLQYLQLDIRSLSFFRIILGLSILYNIVFVKWSFITFLLGDMAFIPLQELNSFIKVPDYSIFDIFNTTSFVRVFMFLYFINTILFTIGFNTKITSVLSVFFQFNLFQALSPLTLEPDMFNFHLSFWAMFLPLGSFLSIDKILKLKREMALPSLSISIVLLFQIGCIYFFSSLFKYNDPWISGYAVRNIMLDQNYTRWIYTFLRDNEFIYKPLTYLIIFFGLLVLPLIFIKWNINLLRGIVVLFLLFFHGIIFLSYDFSNFPIAGFSVATLLIPSSFWNHFSFFQFDMKTSKTYLIKNLRFSMLFLFFSTFSIYIIFERNIYNYYSYVEDVSTTDKMNKFQIPSVAVASFFTQYWRMFAPEPQDHIGWIEICKSKRAVEGQEIYTCDVVFNSLLDKKSPLGWEAFLINLSKNSLQARNENNRYFKYLSKWLVWKIATLPNDGKEVYLEDYYLIEHRVLCGNQSNAHVSKDIRHIYNASDIVEGKIIEVKQ